MPQLYNVHCNLQQRPLFDLFAIYNHDCSPAKNEGQIMLLGERVKKAREYAELNQEQLAQRIGTVQQTVSALESGKNKTSRYTAQIAIACGVSVDWLANERGTMVDGGENNARGGIAVPGVIGLTDVEGLPDDAIFLIPALRLTNIEGVVIVGFDDSSSSVRLPVLGSWMKEWGAPPEALRTAIAQNDAMAGEINAKEQVVIDTSDTAVVDGRIYAFAYPNDTVVRFGRLFRLPDGYLARFDNPSHPEFKSPNLMVIGRVLRALRVPK